MLGAEVWESRPAASQNTGCGRRFGIDSTRCWLSTIVCDFTMNKKLKSTILEQSEGVELEMVAKAKLPTRYGDFTIYGFKGGGALDEAVALVRGNLKGKVAPLVRVHSQCLTGDVL